MSIRRLKSLSALLITLSGMSLSGCGILYLNSEAPGCTRVLFGISAGGCSGTTVIRDVQIEPQIECLKKVAANNCNGGMLEFSNFCEKALIFGDVAINDYVNSLDVIRDDAGNWIAVESTGNFTQEIVEKDTRITLNGTLGDQEVTLSFTKSAPLCDAR